MEEADYRSTAELFAKKGDEKTLDNFIPKSESDFLEYAELISNKLRPYEVSSVCSLILVLLHHFYTQRHDFLNCRYLFTFLAEKFPLYRIT